MDSGYGYVCFAYTKKNFPDWCISKFTKSRWSHSFITIPSVLNRAMALEATQYGVSAAPFDINYEQNDTQIYEIYQLNCPQDKIDAAISLCMNKLETSYGYLEYLWFMWRSFNMLFGRDIRAHNNWCQQGTVCSGLVRTFLEGCGFTFFAGFGKDAVSPQDIYNVVKARSDLFTLISSKN